MTTFRLILRNLFYFRAASLAVVAGMIVATAALAGSLMVGDSVRGSLRDLAVRRLGPIDYALVSTRFFDDSAKNALVDRVAKSAGIAEQFDLSPAIIATGTASAGNAEKKTRTSGVQIISIGGEWAKVAKGSAILNAELYSAIGPLPIPGAGPKKKKSPSKEAHAKQAQAKEAKKPSA